MLNLLALTFGLVAIVALAKLNKSNKLFMSLSVALLLGFVGGSLIGKMLNTKAIKKAGTEYVTPMQMSTALTYITPQDGISAPLTDALVIVDTNSAGLSCSYRDIVPQRTSETFNPETDIGNIDTENTS